jgi:hypothetical protein
MKQAKERCWQDIIRHWERSGISQKEFCKDERIAISTFRYWKKRLEESGEESRFVRVVTEEKPRREISITFDAGIRMIIPDTIPNEALSRMILAVSEALCVSTGTR